METSGDAIPLTELPSDVVATVLAIEPDEPDGVATDLVLRLPELGFIPGEHVRIVARGFPGGEPIAVRVAGTTFALRRHEAERVLVTKPARTGR